MKKDMQHLKILVTGDARFVTWLYTPFFDSLSRYFSVDLCPIPNPFRWSPIALMLRAISKLVDDQGKGQASRYDRLEKSRHSFILRSRYAESTILNRKEQPDLIFHIFCSFAPFATEPRIPYVMWLDYTMALAHRNYRPWAPFKTDKDRQAWLACETRAYEYAQYIFTMTEFVRESVIQDYGISPDRLTVVGSAGNFRELHQGPKAFGSMKVLFYGSDFFRKGGDLLLQAWPTVGRNLPGAKLVIVGSKKGIVMDGVEDLGYIASREQMKELFLESDLVVAPARCEPFGTFLLEAMNFGVPCIVSDRDGLVELVIDGISGIVLKNLDPPSIASTVVGMLSDPAKLKLFSENARQLAKKRFNWDVIAEKVASVLMESPKKQHYI